jgi:uncharacterized protein YprB with RNaseH-like and TPR domain
MKHLNDADILVSFNGIEFDTPILQSVTGLDLLPEQYDILHEIWKALMNRVKGYKLNDICVRLGLGEKVDNGASAIQLYHDGEFATLYAYCRQDVWLTKRLMDFINRYGYIITPDGEYLELPRLEA